MSDNWPIIRCTPGPTDAELEAERDVKHAVDIALFDALERNDDYVPPWAVRG